MVHKFKETMTDVGAGIGGFTEGLYPLATLPILFSVHKPVEGAMKRVTKEIEGKKMGKKSKKKVQKGKKVKKGKKQEKK